MPNTERDTVVLADDHNIVREGIAALCAAGTLACVIPGWRAARVNPVTALRAE